jgi:hypothetical protein
VSLPLSFADQAKAHSLPRAVRPSRLRPRQCRHAHEGRRSFRLPHDCNGCVLPLSPPSPPIEVTLTRLSRRLVPPHGPHLRLSRHPHQASHRRHEQRLGQPSSPPSQRLKSSLARRSGVTISVPPRRFLCPLIDILPSPLFLAFLRVLYSLRPRLPPNLCTHTSVVPSLRFPVFFVVFS